MATAITFEWANPTAMSEARTRLHLSHADVSAQSKNLDVDYVRVSAEDLAAWEAGEAEPNFDELRTLAEIYVCPVGWFFLPHIPKEDVKLDFRTLDPSSKLSPETRQTLARFIEALESAERIAVEAGRSLIPKLETIDLANIDAVVADQRRILGFTDKQRQSWANPEQAFDWWRRRIERLGVFCFVMPLESGDIRGASLRGPGGGAFILVNTQDAEASTGRLFTLLHEYGHLIASQNSVCSFRGDAERQANRFAARMLLGHDELKEQLVKLGLLKFRKVWSDPVQDEIRKPFFVSRDVISIALQELDLAPPDFYSSRRALWSSRARPKGGGRARPKKAYEQRLTKFGYSFASLVSSPEVYEKVSPLELAYLLDVKVEKLPVLLEELGRAAGERR
jgi:Zn-dependent peptidase ImmA (M78 family)